ncbi:transposase [Epilithonimonas tenax]|uniref:transposase n=1 Tax=Epilithonimonas tenax TaxID=191577 RepID=UPI000426C82F
MINEFGFLIYNGEGVIFSSFNFSNRSVKESKGQAKNCGGCPIRSVCHNFKHNRSVERSHQLEENKAKSDNF